MPDDSPFTTRRSLLAGFAASPIAATGVGVFPNAARAEAKAAGLITPNVCMVLPEVTEGPFYLDEKLLRSEIAEDRDGVPLRLRMQVVTADCEPIAGARVDVWHCDAQGNYSGFAIQGSDSTEDTSEETFLRGTQTTGEDGIASFSTIYPGWYRGRTTHIHYKVFLDETTVLTSQIFFPDALSQYLYQAVPPYSERDDERDTTNGNDGIAKQAGEGAFAAVREQPEHYDAMLVVGVDRDADGTETAPEDAASGPAPGGQTTDRAGDARSAPRAGVFIPGVAG
ncbi:MAG: protocatechuate dioxygenase [Rhodobacteraceae bacterium]|jgi:protocatechuate 3,4-dioxygenase beta subunit|uniref:Protocatechuate 3,4-dioxygenase beta subunit n=1 Tax=Salipiger profundus TaxID=1229727 RepID=A0A1U7D1B2_9RHOB|nr:MULTISPECIES: intradiol ring-cleavage dioxygenase [Salipiger]APX21947.1 protocatechuate 3,4-dioxygenase beta subunit [Salipiger profundus]MAB08122.1 protocatechuate dioxygenase [Paracoccaceae bacterium]GGA06418.1 twin-arginine translocation pathway signal protein [Salipiger profundus]SFC38276.1 Protocatechuate 3,4-dioxygenase beta subunit [Salipiger profundus]